MAVANVFYPRDRYLWSLERYQSALEGAAVRIDTPADVTDSGHGLTVLSDAGVVERVQQVSGGMVGVVLKDGFEVRVEVDSVVAVCREVAHRHGGGSGVCPLTNT